MTSRSSLKEYFNTNDVPTETQFADLIDSLAHVSEDNILTESQKNAANGVAGLDADGNIVGFVETYSDTEANLKLLTIPDGAIVYATDTQSYFKGDGATAGGVFQKSIPFLYGNGLNGVSTTTSTELTSTSSVVIASQSLPAQSSWRARGLMIFDGDSDNQSNFRVTFNKFSTGWAPWITPSSSLATLHTTFMGFGGWSFPSASSVEVGTATMQTFKSSAQSTNITSTPTDLTKSHAHFFFDVTFGSALAGTFSLQSSLRQAKIGTPTINVLQFTMMLERLK